MKQRGFTIVELIIVIAIIGIILGLAFASFRSTQVAARDNTRKSAAETISRGLELYYRSGNPTYSISAGHYPSIDEIRHARGNPVVAIGPQVTGGYAATWLSGVNASAGNAIRPITDYTTSVLDSAALMSATPPYDTYIIEPLEFDGTQWIHCQHKDDGCIRMRVYYRTEVDGQMQVIESEHQ